MKILSITASNDSINTEELSDFYVVRFIENDVILCFSFIKDDEKAEFYLDTNDKNYAQTLSILAKLENVNLKYDIDSLQHLRFDEISEDDLTNEQYDLRNEIRDTASVIADDVVEHHVKNLEREIAELCSSKDYLADAGDVREKHIESLRKEYKLFAE